MVTLEYILISNWSQTNPKLLFSGIFSYYMCCVIFTSSNKRQKLLVKLYVSWAIGVSCSLMRWKDFLNYFTVFCDIIRLEYFLTWSKIAGGKEITTQLLFMSGKNSVGCGMTCNWCTAKALTEVGILKPQSIYYFCNPSKW